MRGYDDEKKMARVEVKNRFDLGQEIEFISPTKRWIEESKAIYKILHTNHSRKGGEDFLPSAKFGDDHVESVEAAHGGSYEVWINAQENP